MRKRRIALGLCVLAVLGLGVVALVHWSEIRRGVAKIRRRLRRPDPDPGNVAMFDTAQPGEAFVYDYEIAGVKMRYRYEVTAKDADALTIVMTVVDASFPIPPPTTHKYPLRKPAPETERLPEPRVLGYDLVRAAGEDFDCKIIELDLGGPAKGKAWICEDEYPGLIKQTDADGKVMVALMEIHRP